MPFEVSRRALIEDGYLRDYRRCWMAVFSTESVPLRREAWPMLRRRTGRATARKAALS